MPSSLLSSDQKPTLDTTNQSRLPEPEKNDRSQHRGSSTQQHNEQHDHVSESSIRQSNQVEVNSMNEPRQRIETYEIVPSGAQLVVSNDSQPISITQGSKMHRYRPASPLKSNIKPTAIADHKLTGDFHKSRHVKLVDSSDSNVRNSRIETNQEIVSKQAHDRSPNTAAFKATNRASFNAHLRGSTSDHTAIHSPIARPTSDPLGTTSYTDQKFIDISASSNGNEQDQDEFLPKQTSDPEVLVWRTACAYQNLSTDRRLSNMTDPEMTFRGHRDSVTLARYKAMHEDAPTPAVSELGDSISIAKKRMQARNLDRYRKS